MARKDPQYTPLSQYVVDEGECSYSDSIAGIDEPLSPLSPQLESKYEAVFNAILRWERVTRGALFLLSVILLTLWIITVNMRKCTYVAKYSPANEAIEYLERVKYKATLRFTTPWRGDESGNPSSDIDTAWRRISTDVKPIRVTKEQLHKMGIVVSPTMVTIPQEEGGGYLASLEVTHHLHCLDMLRKATYREYYESFDPAFQIEIDTLMNQLDTCVDILRQALMCYPDINMVPYYWVRGSKAPFPDSSTIHRCKDFEKIIDWATWRAINVFRISTFPMEKTEDGITA